MSLSRRDLLAATFAAAGSTRALAARDADRLRSSSRQPLRNGWIAIRLTGAPNDIGFQHGFHLATEIATAHRTIKFELQRDSNKPWKFYRNAARQFFWPRLDDEYKAELEGIAEGCHARKVKLDVWDITAYNAWLEWAPYFLNWHDNDHSKAVTADRCSAFVATGSYTTDGRPVIGHNAWTSYTNGVYWNIIFDIQPQHGHRIFMDGYPGLIHSGDDFGMNTAGIVITETTITQFDGYDPEGIPEFQRARKAMQYATSIDEYATLMKTGNNGGYANNWLVADNKTGEIADLELGVKNVTLLRTKDGFFAGSNFPVSEKLAREETQFDLKDASHSANARRKRWNQLMARHQGRIDAAAAKRFLSDHHDAYEGKDNAPSERTLCGHIDLSPRGLEPWMPPFGPCGAVQNKVASAAMADKLTLSAAMGHACGQHFKAAAHLKAHPRFVAQKPYLKDLDAHPWTDFQTHA